jgi:hypothetical protein
LETPLVSGLTIIRNGVRLNYPFIEAIRSALPICDEYIVVAGDSDDETLEHLAALNEPKLRIIHTQWSPLVSPQKYLLAQQTNIGLGFCNGRWCLYLQANEVLHEDALPKLRHLMETHAENPEIEAMLVERLTFWSDYRHYIPVYPRRFKYTPRIIRPHIGTYSIRDAMSFAVFDDFSTHGRYPRAIDTGCDVYRYGYVHSVAQQAEKFTAAVHKKEADESADQDYYHQHYPQQFIAEFEGSHPEVMRNRVNAYPSSEFLDTTRCRTHLTLRERKRLLETWVYSRSGLPQLSRNRFRLVGKLQEKPRPRLRLFSGSLT